MKQTERIDLLIRKIVRLRDKDKPCIICGNKMYNVPVNNCHYIKASKSKLFRWSLDNCHLGHESCNNLSESDSYLMDMHRANMLERIGAEKLMYLHNHKNDTYKFRKSDLDELEAKLKEQLKTLEFNDLNQW